MTASQKQAVRNYRDRLADQGLKRYEVLGLADDRELIRTLARRLAGGGVEATRLRASVAQTLGGDGSRKGGVLAALRRSPLVGADLDLARPRETGRKVDL